MRVAQRALRVSLSNGFTRTVDPQMIEKEQGPPNNALYLNATEISATHEAVLKPSS